MSREALAAAGGESLRITSRLLRKASKIKLKNILASLREAVYKARAANEAAVENFKKVLDETGKSN
jgi:hypothetical protein